MKDLKLSKELFNAVTNSKCHEAIIQACEWILKELNGKDKL